MRYASVMGNLHELSRRVPSALKGIAAVAVAWGAMYGPTKLFPRLVTELYYSAVGKGGIHGPVAEAMRDLAYEGNSMLGLTLLPLVIAVTFGVPFALLLRMIARARVRAGLPDLLDPAREWTALHPRGTRALVALPTLTALALLAFVAHDVHTTWIAGLACVLAAGAPLVVAARHAWRRGALRDR